MALISCPECQKEVSSAADACPSCGHPILGVRRGQVVEAKSWSGGIAALLSFLIPGAGQMYKGQVGVGIAWLIFTVLGYGAYIVPGLVLHFICIMRAASAPVTSVRAPVVARGA